MFYSLNKLHPTLRFFIQLGFVYILFHLLFRLGIWLMELYPYEPPFAEFKVSDVSQPQSFVDSVSSSKGSSHLVILLKITGELDDSAEVSYGVYTFEKKKGKKTSKFEMLSTQKLSKGKINIDVRNDFYSSDTVHIFFTPKGSKKGWVKIRTSIR
ncbi:hypothetical protein [Flectobacillus roseus]|uniref:Uncharacterized protein n=1 Tax=Flectobacillus roseus TaxID=502259 RepID=A0ABT6Y429_9BACT|nr:hypothetical protein [Flectobacillus roseus]MDI9858219.1 hypothetical protein [Flectobacillus roseus]